MALDRVLHERGDLGYGAKMGPDCGFVIRKLVAKADDVVTILGKQILGIEPLDCPVQLVEMPALPRVGRFQIEIHVRADTLRLALDGLLDPPQYGGESTGEHREVRPRGRLLP